MKTKFLIRALVVAGGGAGLCLAALSLLAADGKARSTQAASQQLIEAPFRVELSGTITSKRLLEASGIAASRRNDRVLWMHNDSGSAAGIYAVDVSGRTLGYVAVRGASARDWEDMASFDYAGRPMLMVADVGDNEARRKVGRLHFFEEPVIPVEGLSGDASVDVAWSMTFRFPDGAADCEAVAVDVASGQVLLLTKRQNPPQLFAVPIAPQSGQAGRVVDATHLTAVTTIPRPRAEDLLHDPMFGVYGSQPTGMDIAGRQLIILTYRHAYVYTRDDDQAWTDAVTIAPQIIYLPRMKQGESIAFDRHGADAFVSSEKRNAPIYRLVRNDMPQAGAISGSPQRERP